MNLLNLIYISLRKNILMYQINFTYLLWLSSHNKLFQITLADYL